MKVTYVLLSIISTTLLFGSKSNNAIDQLISQAKSGNTKSQIALGDAYYAGVDIGKNDLQALYWYQQAADLGIAEAQFSVGTMYFYGKGIPKETERGLHWFRRAANQGDPKYQYIMGLLLEDGTNNEHAFSWYIKAADQSHPAAQSRLGVLLRHNASSITDYEQSLYWQEKAFNNFNVELGKAHDKSKESLYELMHVLYSLALFYDIGIRTLADERAAHGAIEHIKKYTTYIPEQEKSTYEYLAERLKQNIGIALPMQLSECDVRVHLFTESKEKGVAQYYIKALRQLKAHQNIGICLDYTVVEQAIKQCDEEFCAIDFNQFEEQLSKTDVAIFSSEAIVNFKYDAAVYMYNVIITSSMPDAYIIQHEFMHIYDFKDEYDIGTDSIYLCHSKIRFTASNLIFAKKSIPTQDLKKPSLWSPKYNPGFFPAKTCINTDDGIAYKPVNDTTLLETGLHIPNIYQSIVERKITSNQLFNGEILYSIGMYFNDKKDINTRIKWLKKAAEMEHVNAQFELGYSFEEYGSPIHDYKKAAYWYLKAAKAGHNSAQMFLADLYEFGHGVEKNAEKAEYWLNKWQENSN